MCWRGERIVVLEGGRSRRNLGSTTRQQATRSRLPPTSTTDIAILTSDQIGAVVTMPIKHHVFALDAWLEPPKFDFETDVTVIRDLSANSRPEQLKDATIMMLSGTPLTAEMMKHAPRLQLVAVNGTGTNHIDDDYISRRGITLCKVPAQNTDSVSEHAFALYYALRRQILPMHRLTMEGETWAKKKTVHTDFGRPPRTNAEETMVR
jgi:glycerate dehydrogenase